MAITGFDVPVQPCAAEDRPQPEAQANSIKFEEL